MKFLATLYALLFSVAAFAADDSPSRVPVIDQETARMAILRDMITSQNATLQEALKRIPVGGVAVAAAPQQPAQPPVFVQRSGWDVAKDVVVGLFTFGRDVVREGGPLVVNYKLGKRQAEANEKTAEYARDERLGYARAMEAGFGSLERTAGAGFNALTEANRIAWGQVGPALQVPRVSIVGNGNQYAGRDLSWIWAPRDCRGGTTTAGDGGGTTAGAAGGASGPATGGAC